MTKTNALNPVVDSRVEEMLVPSPTVPVHNSRPASLAPDYDDKGTIEYVEKKMVDEEDDDPNSPEAILQRYPLLRNKSEKELDALNRRVRRRM